MIKNCSDINDHEQLYPMILTALWICVRKPQRLELRPLPLQGRAENRLPNTGTLELLTPPFALSRCAINQNELSHT